MKKILVLLMATVFICASVFALSSCGNGQGGEDDVHTHTMGEWKVIVTVDCINDGKEVRTCTADGCNHTETKMIPALGHELKNVEGLEPNCVEPGYKAYQKCTRCVYNTYVEIPALGHNYKIDAELNPNGDTCVACKQVHVHVTYGDWYTEIEADCTITGMQAHKCVDCNYVATQTTPKVEHNFDENNKCTECGDVKSDATELPDHEFN